MNSSSIIYMNSFAIMIILACAVTVPVSADATVWSPPSHAMRNDAEIFTISGHTYAFVTNIRDGGVQILNLTDPTYPVPVGEIYEEMFGFYLDVPNSVEILFIAGHIYAVMVGFHSDDVRIVNVTDPTHPVLVGGIHERPGEPYAFSRSCDVATSDISGRTYVIVTGIGYYGGMLIVNITDPEYPDTVSDVYDVYANEVIINELRLPEYPIPISDILGSTGESHTFSGGCGVLQSNTYNTYAVVTGHQDDAVQVIDITDPVRPAQASNMVDIPEEPYTFRYSCDMSMYTTSGHTYGVVTSCWA